MINKPLVLTYLYLFIYILLSSGVILYNKVMHVHCLNSLHLYRIATSHAHFQKYRPDHFGNVCPFFH